MLRSVRFVPSASVSGLLLSLSTFAKPLFEKKCRLVFFSRLSHVSDVDNAA
ncbi:hypothetical protein QO005_000209 [Rhizobium paknamense]|uniref:Uncharacterized protein n=1 Tax=Rhizobium paknamense TaxID=1206817 RepID=A0ABU0I9I8_9HYPH|nr:hypothetical protein [Rhizobium paknamense]